MKLRRYAELFETIEKRPLTQKQRCAVLLNEKRNLIVAGAGTGKTSTVIGKIGYLIKSGGCHPDEILVIAYNRAAADEISGRIADLIGKNVKVGTFHSIGRMILSECSHPAIPSKFIDQPSQFSEFISNILDKCLTNNRIRAEFIRYFVYHEYPEKDEQKDFKSLSQYERWTRNTKLETLNGERVKSYGELYIANFLFVNGVSYEYEKEYFSTEKIRSNRMYRPDFYLKDFNIYIEYFGTDKNGGTARFIDRQKYNQEMEWKKKTHKENGTDLISLYYHQNKSGSLVQTLRNEFRKRKLLRRPVDGKTIVKNITDKRYDQSKLKKFVGLVIRFLAQYKENLQSSPIHHLKKRAATNKRTSLFLSIFEEILNEYNTVMRDQKSIDFGDMISLSTELVKKKEFIGPWKYIIVDEFQDISEGRCQLISSLVNQSRKNKLFCVGDDWQAIYRFAGSNYRIMTQFEKIFGNSTILPLNQTFRFNNQIAEVSGSFISQNKSQIEKKIRSISNKKSPQVFLHWSSDEQANGIKKIILLIKESQKPGQKTLQILTRYNKNRPDNDEISEFEKLWDGVLLPPRTIHSAKGLEADYVIVADLNSKPFGFPSELEGDPILDVILSDEDPYPNSEERRLLYVALTRAREQTHLLADTSNQSDFAIELGSGVYAVRVLGSQTSATKYN